MDAVASVFGQLRASPSPEPHPPPLYWPDGQRPSERTLIRVGLILVTIASLIAAALFAPVWILATFAAVVTLLALHHANGRRTVEDIVQQLEARPDFPRAAWGSEERAAIARVFGEAISEETGWPNPNFAPDDPLEIAVYCPWGDGIELLVIAHEIGKKLGRTCEWGDVTTLGQWVDLNHLTDVTGPA